MLAVLEKVAGLNKAGGKAGIVICGVRYQHWNLGFCHKNSHSNACSTDSRVGDGPPRWYNVNGPIRTFFAGVMGKSGMNVAARATAASGTAGVFSPWRRQYNRLVFLSGGLMRVVLVGILLNFTQQEPLMGVRDGIRFKMVLRMPVRVEENSCWS